MSYKNYMPKFKTLTLRVKITILIIIISVYPMALMGIIAAYNYDNIIKERFISYSTNNMNRISSYLNSDVSDMENSIRFTLQDPTFYELILKQPSTLKNSLEMFDLRRDIRSYLSTIVFAKKNYDVGGIYFYDNPQNIFYSQEAGLILESEIPYEAMKAALEEERTTKFYITKAEDEFSIYIMQQVLNTSTFKAIGMIYYRVDPDYLEHVFEDGYEREDETVFLYTKDGLLIAREGNLNGEKIIEDNGYFDKVPDVYIQEEAGEDYYIVTENIDSLSLSVITVISSDILTQDSRKVTDLIIILYIANVPIFLSMAYFLYRNIDRPVTHLIGKMNQFEAGHFDVQVEEGRDDEFGYLYHAFNNMTSNTKKLVNDVYIKELARKDAEIAALQEQINPHFLYNTLESINWRAQLAGENDIALMIQALSKLMDGSINRYNEKFITMEKELDYMRQYMYLVQMRYSEGLTFVEDIDEEIMACYVPMLIIQPLLENAVKHGIEPVGDGTIELKCHKVNHYIEIEVIDNGKGMGAYGLRKIRESIDREIMNVNKHAEKRQSIGFLNVVRRMELIYNGKAVIEVDSKMDQGTHIRLKIPYSNRLDVDRNIILEEEQTDGQI